jgi:hypothetical protein
MNVESVFPPFWVVNAKAAGKNKKIPHLCAGPSPSRQEDNV